MEQHQEGQLKIDYCISEMCYANFMENTKQTPMADIKKIKKKKEFKYTTTESHQITKSSREKERNY